MKQTPPPQTENSKPLFRSQAVAYQARSIEGDVMLSLTMRMRVLVIILTLIVVIAMVFAATANYSRTETVSGWVVPDEGLIRILAKNGGTIKQLSVTEGEDVKAGQSLAVLRLSQGTANGDAGKVIAEYLQTELLASRAKAKAEHERLMAEQQSLLAQKEAMKRALEASKARIETVSGRQKLAQANMERVQSIAARGFASKKAVEDSQSVMLSLEQEMVDVRTGILDLERQIQDIDAQLKSLPFSIKSAEADARASEAALKRQNTEQNLLSTYHVTASVDGRVVAIPVEPGQTLSPQAGVAVIIPKGSHLQAELFLPSRAAGFISKGQEVRLMYQAFPFEKFGTAKGEIISISRTVLSPSDIQVPGLEINEPVFRIKVKLESEMVKAYGKDMPIQPGMLVSAGIIQDRRTLIEWLLDPIYAVGRM